MDLVLLPRSTVARVLELVESLPAASVLDVRVREELRHGLAVASAARVGALLAARADTPGGPQMSREVAGAVDARPFGRELTTKQAAALLGVGPRQVRRRCRFGAEHPDRLRGRLRRGAFVVSGADVDASRAGG